MKLTPATEDQRRDLWHIKAITDLVNRKRREAAMDALLPQPPSVSCHDVQRILEVAAGYQAVEPEQINKEKSMARFTVKIYNDGKITVTADSYKVLPGGSLEFYKGGEVVAGCAPGCWTVVIKQSEKQTEEN